MSTLQSGSYKKLFGPFGFWQKDHGDKGDFSKRAPRRPGRVEFTGGLPANSETLYGLYYGTIPELQFASPMAYTPVKVPSMLVGIPTPRAQDRKTQKAVKDMMDVFGEECPLINETVPLIGTAWRWVRYSQKLGRVIWEVIPDETVTDIEIDVDTNEIMAVHDHVQIAYSDGYNSVKYVERKRRIGRDRIDIVWVDKSRSFQDIHMKNPFGFIPVPFGHECKETEWRGHSIYGRTLRMMKSNHDIQYSRDEILAKFRPKLAQYVDSGGTDTWLTNNGYSTLNDIDPFDADFFINAGEREKTEFIYLPADATRQHTEALSYNDKKLIIGSGVPEIFWGGLATGNHASTESQTNVGIAYVHSLRRELNRQYTIIFNQTLTVNGFMEQTQYSEVVNDWDQFEMVSKETQVRIFQMFAQGMNTLIQCAGFSYDDIKYFWSKFYSDGKDRTVDQIKEGMGELMDHTLALKGDVYSSMDTEPSEPPPEPATDDSEESDGDDMNQDEKDIQKDR